MSSQTTTNGARAITRFSSLRDLSVTYEGRNENSSVTIDPGTQTTLGSISGGAPYGSVVDGTGNVYVVDHAGNQVIELAAGSQETNGAVTTAK